MVFTSSMSCMNRGVGRLNKNSADSVLHAHMMLEICNKVHTDYLISIHVSDRSAYSVHPQELSISSRTTPIYL